MNWSVDGIIGFLDPSYVIYSGKFAYRIDSVCNDLSSYRDKVIGSEEFCLDYE